MPINDSYAAAAPTRAEIDALDGPVMIEFGNAWCGHCCRAQPQLEAALQPHSALRHLKIADGPGQPLGRSFAVKLWPTLIFLKDGKEFSRLVRPATLEAITEALAQIDPGHAISG